MDLSHIRGEAIARGDIKHLYNFLQLLFELARLFKTQSQQDGMSLRQDPNIQSTPISREISHREDDEIHRNHSVMGINQEFADRPDFLVYDQNAVFQQQKDMQYQKQQQQNKNQKAERISEASKSKESSQYDHMKMFQKKENKKTVQQKKSPQSGSDQPNSSSKRGADKKNLHNYYPEYEDMYPEDFPGDLQNLDPELARQYMEQMKQQGIVFSDNELNQFENKSSSQSNDRNHRANPKHGNLEQPQGHGKQIHRSKSTRDLADKNDDQEGQESGHSQIQNNKHNQIKALEDNMLPITQKQHRIITTNPNIATQKQPSKEQQQEESLSPDDISEIDMNFLEQIDPEQVAQLSPSHPTYQKYQRELEKIQLYEHLQQQQENIENQNIDDVIEAQIYNVKESLKNMREKRPPIDEQKTLDQIVRKRNEYKTFLKDYLNQYNQNQKQLIQSKSKTQGHLGKKMKKIHHEENDLKKQFEHEHLSMYYKMRDEKLNYLRKIHRIIFELEKRKIIDEKKDHLQLRRQQNVATRNALSSIENAYNDRIAMLKDKLRQERQERHVSSVAQKQVEYIFNNIQQILSKIERELKQEKMRQIGELRDVYKQEKEKFEFIIKDDGQLEQKILSIYKKY